jgi:hypothetical protein
MRILPLLVAAGAAASICGLASGVSTVSLRTLPAGGTQSETFTLSATGTHLMVMTTPLANLPTNFDGPDTVAEVRNASNVVVVSNDNDTADFSNSNRAAQMGSTVRVRTTATGPTANGSFSVRISGASPSASGLYAYTTGVFTPTTVPDFSATSAANGTMGAAAPTSLGYGSRLGRAQLDFGASVFLSLTLNAGDVLSAMTSALDIPFTDPDTFMNVLDSSGTPLVSNDNAGSAAGGGSPQQGSAVRFRADAAGTYFLQVTGGGEGSSGNALVLASVVAVPAPAGAAVLGLGALLGVRRRR